MRQHKEMKRMHTMTQMEADRITTRSSMAVAASALLKKTAAVNVAYLMVEAAKSRKLDFTLTHFKAE